MNFRALFATALALVCLLVGGGATNQKPAMPDTRVYELRVYTFNPEKKEDLLNRFRNHTLRLFQKHGVESVGYWLPLDQSDNRLHFLLRYPSREAREASWKAFMADPEWQAAYQASEAKGPLLARPPENFFLQATDFSPAVRTGDLTHGGVFELRTYTTPAGLLPNLDARFRDHTMALFAKHGINSYGYFHRMADQPSAEVTLQYLVMHKSKDGGAASFGEFRKDPDWVAAKEASETKAGGSLTVPDGVNSVYMAPVDFSPTK
ncbi:MAG TPA: NIPSNAP family protein [Candidatus Limnocylindria bacterium]|nr:NIPSNAP family protein [Candidatus Limnocylindria bacterium]